MAGRRLFLGYLMMGMVLGAGSGLTAATNAAARRTEKPAAAPLPSAAVAAGNPLLPTAAAVGGFFPELGLVQKVPTIAPAGFEPLYSGEEWAAYRSQFGAEADGLTGKRSSVVLEFSNKLIAAAEIEKAGRPGLARLLLFRAAAVCYRNRDGFETANKAVRAYQKIMEIPSATQVGALWTISNGMSRLAVTPKAERIGYSGIAARANCQLAILLLEADQIEAASSVVKLVGYHEGWLKSDPAVRATIAQTRAAVRQSSAMMDFLGTQYKPAINGDDSALMALFIYGRFVKNNPALVADFPSRKPNSPMAQLAAALAAGEHDPAANYTAAETLGMVAAGMPDGVLKKRAMYASLERYRSFIKAPETAKERMKRTLAFMAIQAAVADGARPGIAIHPFEVAKPANARVAVETEAGGGQPAGRGHVATGAAAQPAGPAEPRIEPAVVPQRSGPGMPTPSGSPAAEPDGPIVG